LGGNYEPLYADQFFYLGEIYSALGNEALAKKCFQDCTVSDPESIFGEWAERRLIQGGARS